MGEKLKPCDFFKYTSLLLNEANFKDRERGIIELRELEKLLVEKTPIHPIDFIRLLFQLDLAKLADFGTKSSRQNLAETITIMVKSNRGDKKKRPVRFRKPERSFRRAQLEKIVENQGTVVLKIPPGGLKKRICFQCVEFSLLPNSLRQCRLCWRMTHPSCDKLCVCLSQNKIAKQTAETTIPSSQVEILGLEKTKITLGDKNFLTQLFPSSTISASDKQPLDHLESQKNATETVLKSPFDNSNHRRLISEAERDAIRFIENAKLTLHKYPLRCAKCFKAATCQTNCCEYHVFCDLCKEQAITCEDENREVLTKMQIGSYRGKVIQFVTKHWHEKYKDTVFFYVSDNWGVYVLRPEKSQRVPQGTKM